MTSNSTKPTTEQLKEFDKSEGTFRNASLHRHFGGSKDSFGRMPIYIPSDRPPGFFGRVFGMDVCSSTYMANLFSRRHDTNLGKAVWKRKEGRKRI